MSEYSVQKRDSGGRGAVFKSELLAGLHSLRSPPSNKKSTERDRREMMVMRRHTTYHPHSEQLRDTLIHRPKSTSSAASPLALNGGGHPHPWSHPNHPWNDPKHPLNHRTQAGKVEKQVPIQRWNDDKELRAQGGLHESHRVWFGEDMYEDYDGKITKGTDGKMHLEYSMKIYMVKPEEAGESQQLVEKPDNLISQSHPKSMELLPYYAGTRYELVIQHDKNGNPFFIAKECGPHAQQFQAEAFDSATHVQRPLPSGHASAHNNAHQSYRRSSSPHPRNLRSRGSFSRHASKLDYRRRHT